MTRTSFDDAAHASGTAGGVVVCAANWVSQREEIAALFVEFYQFLRDQHDFDAPFICKDAAALPGAYDRPQGEVLVALVDGTVAGCFCLRPHPGYTDGMRTAEAKRMFIRPEYRGMGLGGALVDAILQAARQAGYHEVLLDSLRSLPDAHRLYYKRGFTLIPQYNELPSELVFHMRCVL